MSQRRVIVAQPAALCREGAGLLQVGVLRWMAPPRTVDVDGTKLVMAPEPLLTFVVKATFSYAKCGSAADEMALADEPEGLALDVPSEIEGADGEIAYASDFVPLKRRCDVVLSGHAHAQRPATRLPARFTLGSLSRELFVESRMPALRAPLSNGAIRARDSQEVAEPVGPTPTPPLLEDYPHGFDFIAYNTAAASQQIDDVPPGAKLTLAGLSERAETLALKLPAIAPVAWVDTTEERGIPLELSCDTVWIDTDRELCVLVYRAILSVSSLDFDGVTQVTLALAAGGVSPKLEDVRRDLARGVFEAAVELADFEDDARPAPEPSVFARYAVWDNAIEPSISLSTYALVSAALAESKTPRNETLDRHGFDEDGFLIEERGWLTKMAEAAMKGDAAPATHYGELFVAAQDSLAGAHEGQESIDEYARLKVDMEDAADPTTVLTARKMTLSEWMRMDRRWTRRALNDRATEVEIERQAWAYRASKGEA